MIARVREHETELKGAGILRLADRKLPKEPVKFRAEREAILAF